jgi:flagellar basal body-associated protein FliL
VSSVIIIIIIITIIVVVVRQLLLLLLLLSSSFDNAGNASLDAAHGALQPPIAGGAPAQPPHQLEQYEVRQLGEEQC